MFYQEQPKLDVYFRKTLTGHNQLSVHLHSFFELHCCTEGRLRLTVEDRVCELQAGEAALIFPYQPHSFARTGGKGFFFTFDPELIGTFANRYTNLVPVDNRFLFTYDFQTVNEESDLYAIKSFLYAICSAASKLEYVSAPVDGRALLEKIFFVTEENYREPGFSLLRLSEMLGYDYGYLSKYFLKMTGMKFIDYLNQRRVAHSVQLLQNGKVSEICDAAFASGYSTIRSFNRNFKRIEGKTPREYAGFSRNP